MNLSRIARRSKYRVLSLAVALALGLSACGGGGDSGTTATTGTPGTPTPVTAAADTFSSGAISAFGSVFVNGHEFNTDRAQVIDDDDGTTAAGAAGLEVGMVVDVKQDAASAAAAPAAAELHVHPLARGFVDAADATAGTLKVMGQTVQLTSATGFSDHRACVSAATPTCTAIATAAGLTTTAVIGTATTPGSYVTVHGYLFASSAASANIVATLVSVADAPTGSSRANFKAEGTVTVGTATLAIGGLTVDLSKATCFAGHGKTACGGAFTTGQIVSSGAATAPALPATTLSADFARLSSRVPVETAGARVELEGAVASAGTSTFVVRGITVDATSLPAGTAMPKVGDVVRVLGTVASSGQSVTASSLAILHAANSVKLSVEGDAGNVAPGATTRTFTLSVLGQTLAVNAQTHLADVSVRGWDKRNPSTNPFNITTFQSYLASSTSKHVIVRSESDAAGSLIARSLVIVPASTVVAVAGIVDATPPVVNSSVSGTPTKFSVHGIAVSADPAAIVATFDRGFRTLQPVAAGDQVVVIGTLNSAVVTVGPALSRSNSVLDVGPPSATRPDRGEF